MQTQSSFTVYDGLYTQPEGIPPSLLCLSVSPHALSLGTGSFTGVSPLTLGCLVNPQVAGQGCLAKEVLAHLARFLLQAVR